MVVRPVQNRHRAYAVLIRIDDEILKRRSQESADGRLAVAMKLLDPSILLRLAQFIDVHDVYADHHFFSELLIRNERSRRQRCWHGKRRVLHIWALIDSPRLLSVISWNSYPR